MTDYPWVVYHLLHSSYLFTLGLNRETIESVAAESLTGT